VKGFINGENELIDTSLSDHYIKKSYENLTQSLEFYMIEPKQHLDTYSI
jgi:hypothetical protein